MALGKVEGHLHVVQWSLVLFPCAVQGGNMRLTSKGGPVK